MSGRERGHRRQHFVPQSYLKAWCDPATPEGQEPFVWRFNKDGTNPRRKAPENIFHETDLYTIQGPQGARDLVLEHGLAGLESAFVAIRDTKLAAREPITPVEHVLLCAFMAAAQARTPAQRDHFGGQWGKLLEKADRIREWAQTATPEQRRAAGSIAPGGGPSLSYEEVRERAENPMQTMLFPLIRVETPLLIRLDLLVVNCTVAPGFITSDHPCVWFDAEAYKRPPFYQASALMYESIEITLPISSHQMVLLNRRGLAGHLDAGVPMVDELNRRTLAHCSDYFVSSSETRKPVWFDPGVEPEDSWRKRHPGGRSSFTPPPPAHDSRT